MTIQRIKSGLFFLEVDVQGWIEFKFPQTSALADLGGHARHTPPPHGTQFFHFHIHFHQKVPTSEVHAPQWVHAPHGKSWIRHCSVYLECLNVVHSMLHVTYSYVFVQVLLECTFST